MEKHNIVGWISRHPPLPAQVRVLKQKYENCVIFQHAKVFSSAEEITQMLKNQHIKIAVIVAPLSMIAKCVEDKEITWLWAEMNNIHSCVSHQCVEFNPDSDVIVKDRHYRFVRFRKIVKVELVLESL